MTVGVISAQMGGSDCETIGSGVFAQPVNTISSLTYTIIGILIFSWAFSVSGRERWERLIFGVLAASTGIGSVLFHGPQVGVSQFVHDATFLLTLWFLAAGNLADRWTWPPARRWAVTVVGSGAIGVVLWLAPTAANVVMVLGVGLLVASDVSLRMKGRATSGWFMVSLVAILLAVSMFLLGRTGSPYCDPDSLFQGHALWHLLGAISLGSYFVGTSRARLETDTEGAT